MRVPEERGEIGVSIWEDTREKKKNRIKKHPISFLRHTFFHRLCSKIKMHHTVGKVYDREVNVMP